MAFFQRISGLSSGRVFSLWLLMLVSACTCIPINTTGQQVGVTLKLHGVTISNNSLVDLDDILYRAPGRQGYDQPPTNARPHLHDGALLCVTDLVDCCDSPHTVRGDWYYPDGRTVPRGIGGFAFLRNRGPNEIINGRQFYGSVRLFRKWSNPRERGHFRCELPSAADPNVTQILYANIVNFGIAFNTRQVMISPSGPGIAGNSFTLRCSATLISPLPLPSNVPPPSFEWFYGPHGNASLPSGVTPTATVRMSGNIYTSTLLFFPSLTESHTRNYTCRLGAGRLVNSTVVSADDAVIQVTTSGPPVLRQSGYTLICNVLVADRFFPYTITYQWTKSNSSIMEFEVNNELNSLSFSSLRLSDAGQYTCHATVHSFRTNNDITVMASHVIRIQISAPTFVTCKSATPNPVRPIGSTVNLTCVVYVELGPSVDVPVIVSTVWTGPNGFTADNISQPILGISSTTHNITSRAVVSSFERSRLGVYTCTARLNASSSTRPYLIDSITTSGSIQVTTGVYLTLNDCFIANNTQINIRNIGQYSDNPNGALQCITDRKPCCFSPRYGEWHLPNGTLVPKQSHASRVDLEFYRSRENNGRVYLNHHTNNMTPTGRFCCEVPDATNINQTLCVLIDRVSVTANGSPVAGESYFLECSAGNPVVTFQWLGPPDGKTPVVNSSSITIISNSSISRLQFSPLQQSDNGEYSCHTTTNESISPAIEVHAEAPTVSIQINESTGGITGGNFELTCEVLGVENLNPTITYQWTKNTSGGQDQIKAGADSSMLSFTTIQLSDAANYSCTADITSNYLTGSITAVASHSVMVQIPPSFVSLSSSKINDVQIVGSDVMLTCTVELNSAIPSSEIFLLTMNAQLLKEGALLPLPLAGPRVSGTAVTYTAELSPFQRSDFGNYTCSATIRPQPSSTYLTGIDTLSHMITIKSVIPPPLDVRAVQSSPSAPVEVSWSPPSDQGAFSITGYRIFYGSGETVHVSVTTAATSISLRVEGGYDRQPVFLQIRSESDQLSSELVNVTVESENHTEEFRPLHGIDKYRSCSIEIGATAGVMVIVMAIISIFITIIVAICWWRKKAFVTKDIAVSVNAAYKDVVWEADHEEPKNELYYEDIDDMMITKPSHQQPDNEAAAGDCTTDPAASENISAEETTYVH